jgi:hypothetical protein
MSWDTTGAFTIGAQMAAPGLRHTRSELQFGQPTVRTCSEWQVASSRSIGMTETQASIHHSHTFLHVRNRNSKTRGHSETGPSKSEVNNFPPPLLSKKSYQLTCLSTFVRFEVFRAVTMKNAVVWDMTPCDYCKLLTYQIMEGSYLLPKNFRGMTPGPFGYAVYTLSVALALRLLKAATPILRCY